MKGNGVSVLLLCVRLAHEGAKESTHWHDTAWLGLAWLGTRLNKLTASESNFDSTIPFNHTGDEREFRLKFYITPKNRK